MKRTNASIHANFEKNIINAANHIYSSTKIHPQMKVV